MQSRVVIGTRGSKLALAQARIAAARLTRVNQSLGVEPRVITTAGDRNRQARLSDIGGKGVFIRELEQALLDKTIDIAVHSFKDITAHLHPGLELAAFFTPESVCDVLVSRSNAPLAGLPPNALIGTGSMRRIALLSRLRPDLRFAGIRGNIDTRLSKLDRGECDGIVLSEAGLIRLGLQDRIAQRFDPRSFFPAPGQGVIALELRQEDRRRYEAAGDADQRVISLAELSLLERLGFDCRTPMGVHTQLSNEVLCMSGFYIHPGSNVFIERSASGPAHDPAALGRVMGDLLLEGSE
jgi:hydroxymethylbilane synthase